MNLRTISIGSLVSALVIGALGISAPTAFADATTGTVSGTITAEGKPVAGATVQLSNDDYEWGGSATTDAAGRYSITAAPGTGVVRVEDTDNAHGFLATYSGDTVRAPDATPVTVAAGTSLVVDVRVLEGATITGRVVNAKGKPVKDAYVWAGNLRRAGVSATHTDAQGRYVLRGLPSGRVELIAAKGTGTSSKVGTGRVSATQGQSVAAKTLRLRGPKQGSLKVKVKGAKAGDEIWAFDTKSKLPTEFAYVSKNGTSTFTGKLPAGTYRLVIGGTNKASKTVTVKHKKKSDAGTIKAPKKRATLKGTVKTSKGKKAKHVSVSVFDSFGTYAGSATTNAQGKYTVKKLVGGRYSVQLFDVSLKNAPSSAKVTVRKNATTKKNARLAKAFQITGKVTAAGRPVMGVDVFSERSSAVTDANGAFTLRGVSKGKVRLTTYDSYPGGYLSAAKTVRVKNKNLTWNPRLR